MVGCLRRYKVTSPAAEESVAVLPLDLSKLRVFPLAERKSLTRADDILLDPEAAPAPCPERIVALVRECRQDPPGAAARGDGHADLRRPLLRNGARSILERMMARGWLTHLATNGAGTIHDWEYAWLGASTESVEMNVASGHVRHLARNGHEHPPGPDGRRARRTGLRPGAGPVHRRRWRRRFPPPTSSRPPIAAEPRPSAHRRPGRPAAGDARAGWPAGRIAVEHRWKHASILAQAFRHGVPLTVHPGIGYDIISNHPVFNGAAIGRAAEWDFKLFGGSVDGLDGGVVLSVGSAIMGPQVFEKSLSCVNNLRLQNGRDGRRAATRSTSSTSRTAAAGTGRTGEPPKTNPAYYLRFCKSFSRMGGAMHYLQCDNAAFVHNLYRELCAGG